MVKTKSQKVLGANSYLCRSYRGKTGRLSGRGAFWGPPILNRVEGYLHYKTILCLKAALDA